VWPLFLNLFNLAGSAASLGIAGYDIHKKASPQVQKEIYYVGAGVAALAGLAFIEYRKKQARLASVNATVVATAPVTSNGTVVISAPSGAVATLVPAQVSASISALHLKAIGRR
jgi:hypothetical protein